MNLYTIDWFNFEDFFLRKIDFNSMLWFDYINLKNCSVSCAKFGGPIALVQNNVGKTQKNKILFQEYFTIEIFNSFGFKISEITCSSSLNQNFSFFDWSFNEELICVTKKGDIYLYDICGVLKNLINLNLEKKNIVDCKFFSTTENINIVFLTDKNKYYWISSSDNFKIHIYPDTPKNFDLNSISCWDITNFNSKNLEIILCGDNELYLLSFLRPQCVKLHYMNDFKKAKILSLVSSHELKQVCVFLNNGFLIIFEINEVNLIPKFEIETKFHNIPDEIIWFCNVAICIIWKNIISIINIKESYKTYSLDCNIPFFVINEIDGIRLLSNDSHKLLELIPEDVVSVFKIGSNDPAALLLEAYKEFNKKSHKADEYIRILIEKNELYKAIQQCINAAGSEFTVNSQKQLLRAASYGKGFFSSYDSKHFVDTSLKLRLFNIIRNYEIAIPLTFKEYEYIGIGNIVNRLIKLKKFNLALQISYHLNLNDEDGKLKIYREWALFKIGQINFDDIKVGKDIVNKLKNINNLSYFQIANYAILNNRKKLAMFLLNYEKNPIQQVNLLLKLENKEDALQKAIESGNTNLVYKVILSNPFKSLNQDYFYEILNKNSIALKLYEKHLKNTNLNELFCFYQENKNYNEQGFFFLKDSYYKLEKNNLTKKNEFQLAKECFGFSGNDFFITMTEENIRLIKYQQKLEEKMSTQKFVGLSLYQTIKNLIINKFYKVADDVKKDFKITDKMYYWLKIDILSKEKRWQELKTFCNSKKSPIGYEPFVEICLKYKNEFEAQKYLSQVRDENKIKLYAKSGLLEEAARLAIENKNLESIDLVRDLCLNKNSEVEKKLILARNEIISRK